jgi:hypothetical protein
MSTGFQVLSWPVYPHCYGWALVKKRNKKEKLHLTEIRQTVLQNKLDKNKNS